MNKETEAITVTKKYFDLSNQHDFKALAALMHDTTTYSSQNTGVFLGVGQIIEMQTSFHNSFTDLSWKILSTTEPRPGVVLVDFVMKGIKSDGTTIEVSGDEYVVVANGILQHIEVRNK